jgi:hypothetical protein
MREWFPDFQPALFRRKINIIFLLASLQKLFNFKYCSESFIKLLFRRSFALSVGFFQCTFIACYQNSFQDYIRLSKQLLNTQAATRKPEHSEQAL